MKSGTCEFFASAYLVSRNSSRVPTPGWHGERKAVWAECRRRLLSFQGQRQSLIPVVTPVRQVRPVACLIHPDLAPRDAPRTIGPRLDRTRSAGSDEPGGTAIRPGDLCRGPSSSSRAAQAAGGEREKNGGMHAPPPAGRCMRRPSSHDWMAASFCAPGDPQVEDGMPVALTTPQTPGTPSACPVARPVSPSPSPSR